MYVAMLGERLLGALLVGIAILPKTKTRTQGWTKN